MSFTFDYPLRFQPLFRRYLWGGRRLATVLGKSIGVGDDYAESWEVVDHGQDQSVVLSGPAAGKTLREIVSGHAVELLGQHADETQFPLLFKFLDCNRALSVQVHPNDEQGAKLVPPDLGKTEAWIVLAADPGSKVYAGLKPDVTREALRSALEAGTCDACLHEFEPQVGDCIFIEAGTVHALGAGLLIAEIQQASDTTFRLFDWNRVGADGNPRQLHVDESLATIDFSRGPVVPQQPISTGRAGRQRLVDCDKFVLDRCHGNAAQTFGGDDRFHLLAILEGAVEIAGEKFVAGETCLLPAAAGRVEAIGDGDVVLLDAYLPDR
ncbi:MAG: class I mannose-6-phosphate isomerase [Planctomycetes bacterium]|nr:class I mannose-6-phosphate isomerase [Planctomycetota bacterium]